MTTSTGAGPAAGAGGNGAGASDAAAGRRAGGPPVWVFALGAGGLLVAVVLLVLQLLGIGVGIGAPAPTIGPAGRASELTRAQVVAALEAAAFQVQDPLTPYRPGESPALANVPRRLVQAILPSDPNGGYVVIYELPSAAEADSVGRDFLAYLASGTGAIQYPRDTKFVLQRIGPTLVFYPWSAQVNPDPRVPELAAAVATVGEPVRP